MSESKKHSRFVRLLVCLAIGLLVSGGILFSLQPYYEGFMRKSLLREPYFLIAVISALIIGLMLFIPTKKPLRILKWIPRLIIMVLLVAIVFAVGIFYNAQSDILYMHGGRDTEGEAALSGNPQAEQIKVVDGRETWQGYLLKTTPGKAGLVLYFGGNNELAASRAQGLAPYMASGIFGGYHFMMVDYPGYGGSSGEPGEESIMRMARAVYQYALTREDVDVNRVVVAGWSLGTGPAAMLASQAQPAGLILMAPFYTGTDLVNSFLRAEFHLEDRWYTRVPGFLVKNKFSSNRYARLTNTRALVIGASQDKVIPVEQAQRLSAEYRDARFIMLEGGHTAPWSDPASFTAIAAYLGSLSAQPAPAVLPNATAAP